MDPAKLPIESQKSDPSEFSGKSDYTVHYDGYGRRQEIPVDDHDEWYLRPSDGRISKVSVQSFEELGKSGGPAVPWQRIGKPKVKTPWLIQLLYWTYESTLDPDLDKQQSAAARTQLFLRWLPSCFAMLFLLYVPKNLEGDVRYNGEYDPIRYHEFSDTGASEKKGKGNESDGEEHDSLLGIYGQAENDIELDGALYRYPSLGRRSVDTNDIDADYDDLPARHIGPRFLCFLNSEDDIACGGPEWETRLVADWIEESGPGASTNYVFVSYTRKQFFVATDNEAADWNITEEQRQYYREIAPQDRKTLQSYGVRAARKAGVAAFWLDFECLQSDGPDGDISDVWRICDIVRACHSMIIVLGPSVEEENAPATPHTRDAWLHEWGTRLWTLPEILLLPEPKVSIYTIGGDERPELLAKRNFASRAWKDAKLVRQLMDHYESSIHLTPLELLSIGLECFQSRHTDQRTGGDMAYALMGLLRRRPKVNKKDSAFEAFARLSLSNDSDRLLERMVCMLPPNPDAEWFHIRDKWSARLWDIEPIAQVGEILEDETVSLDGAYGATIEWDAMQPPAFFKRQTLMRKFAKILLRGVPIYSPIGIAFTVMGAISMKALIDSDIYGYGEYKSSAAFVTTVLYLVIGSITLAVSVAVVLAAPAMLLNIYGGKFWSTQARLVGVEGRIDLGIVESYLFGFNQGRLKWDKNGSSLDFDDLGRPRWGSLERGKGETAGKNGPDQYGMRLFTLIDTFTMKATPFRARRPPTTLIICGQQGGMQRALLCSYNHRNRTFSRETVIRLSTLVLDRIARIDRFSLALRRQGDGPGKLGSE
ncbi:uncharacterized protein J3D65DRAFT_664993 [Phyllosticta citribraziliensis]|uniref:3-hydroxyisobutyrate dehydrogenase protein n=1 Tax=Phyllosticta citribraziliensis TaxID=989973 RepID=A0ABR1M7Z7_9PEZI